MTPQTPPTDRPLTAGDVLPMMAMAMDKLMRAFPDDCIPSASVCVEVANAINAAKEIIERPATSAASEGEGADALVKELRLAACGLFDLKNDRGDYGYFDTIADRIAALASPPVSERERELEGALPDLFSIIAWLDGGCDPKHAADELRIYKARIDRALAAQPAGEGK